MFPTANCWEMSKIDHMSLFFWQLCTWVRYFFFNYLFWPHQFSLVCLFIRLSVIVTPFSQDWLITLFCLHDCLFFCLKSGFNKLKKATNPFLEENFCYAQSISAFFGTKSRLLNFSLNLEIRIFFGNCTQWQALKIGLKWLFRILRKFGMCKL